MIAEVADDFKQKRIKSRKALLWMGIISIIMLFGALTSGYIVRQGEGKWVQFNLPQGFLISTLIIILSSVTFILASSAIKKNNQQGLRLWLGITLILGIAFVFCQYFAWKDLYAEGIAFSGKISDIKTTDINYLPAHKETIHEAANTGNVAGSFLYMLTGLHVIHLLVGLIVLLVVVSRAYLGKYDGSQHHGVSLAATYWHFLDGLWVYLYLFLLYIR